MARDLDDIALLYFFSSLREDGTDDLLRGLLHYLNISACPSRSVRSTWHSPSGDLLFDCEVPIGISVWCLYDQTHL